MLPLDILSLTYMFMAYNESKNKPTTMTENKIDLDALNLGKLSTEQQEEIIKIFKQTGHSFLNNQPTTPIDEVELDKLALEEYPIKDEIINNSSWCGELKDVNEEKREIWKEGYKAALQDKGYNWISVESGLPQVIDKKVHPVLTWDGKHRRIAYYFPEHFKTIEWDDWDDYSEKAFPYTENDGDNGVVWLRPGFYEEINCDNCEWYWSSPIKATHWQPLQIPPKK